MINNQNNGGLVKCIKTEEIEQIQKKVQEIIGQNLAGYEAVLNWLNQVDHKLQAQEVYLKNVDYKTSEILGKINSLLRTD